MAVEQAFDVVAVDRLAAAAAEVGVDRCQAAQVAPVDGRAGATGFHRRGMATRVPRRCGPRRQRAGAALPCRFNTARASPAPASRRVPRPRPAARLQQPAVTASCVNSRSVRTRAAGTPAALSRRSRLVGDRVAPAARRARAKALRIARAGEARAVGRVGLQQRARPRRRARRAPRSSRATVRRRVGADRQPAVAAGEACRPPGCPNSPCCRRAAMSWPERQRLAGERVHQLQRAGPHAHVEETAARRVRSRSRSAVTMASAPRMPVAASTTGKPVFTGGSPSLAGQHRHAGQGLDHVVVGAARACARGRCSRSRRSRSRRCAD